MCHKFKKDCLGAAIAKECTADRVLLSTHMKEHWEKVGYQPETDSLNEVDGGIELDIQVGRKQLETNVIPDSTYSNKYHSVILKGFRADTSLETVEEVLFQQGLPKDYKRVDIIQSDKNGSITLENLESVDCLSLISNMNRKRFLNRQIYVTSVVSASPVKSADQADSDLNLSSSSGGDSPPDLGNPLVMRTLPSPNIFGPQPDPVAGFVFESHSPTVQQSINHIEGKTSSTKTSDPSSPSKTEKRKSESSPDTGELSRKEKKVLKGEEKKQDKLRKKLEYKQKNTLQINHSY